MSHSFYLFWGNTSGSLLAGLREPHVVVGIKFRLATCTASTLRYTTSQVQKVVILLLSPLVISQFPVFKVLKAILKVNSMHHLVCGIWRFHSIRSPSHSDSLSMIQCQRLLCFQSSIMNFPTQQPKVIDLLKMFPIDSLFWLRSSVKMLTKSVF